MHRISTDMTMVGLLLCGRILGQGAGSWEFDFSKYGVTRELLTTSILIAYIAIVTLMLEGPLDEPL